MTAQTATLEETVRDALADALDSTPGIDTSRVHVQALRVDSKIVWAELAVRVDRCCSRCGQTLGEAGPVSWLDNGEVRGSWNQQHGCGEWNAPASVDAFIEVAERDDPDVDPCVDRQAEALAGQLKEEAAEAREAAVAAAQEQVQRDHAADIASLEAGDDILGDENSPGTYMDAAAGDLEGGNLVTWDHHPTDTDEVIDRCTPFANLPAAAQETIRDAIGEAWAR